MKKISLNGLWSFVPELDPKYHFDWRDKTLHVLPTYSDPEFERSNWKTVPVPGVWQKYGERYDIFEGACWFSKEFEIDEFVQGTPAHIRFGAVNYFCVIYLNGKEVDRHEGGYTEFKVDVSEFLCPGKNHIAVRVDNRSSIVKWPACLGYFNYGGIHRDVTVEIADNPAFDKVFFNAEPSAAGGNLDIYGNTFLYDKNLTVKIECAGEATSCDISLDGSFSTKIKIKDVNAWSPEFPELYSLSIKLIQNDDIIDTYNSFCGFRKIETRDKNIYLNNQKYPLNGICYVYDSPVYGLYMDKETIEKDLYLIKDTGANAVRTHYPMDKVFYEICDRLGLLVWVEPPIYCYHPNDDEKNTFYSDSEWLEVANQMINEMIITSRNHPSVVIYGIGNECNLKNSEALPFFESLANTVRKQNSGRLISYAALYGNIGKLSELIDVLGVNSYWGWYDKVSGGKGLHPKDTSNIKRADAILEPIELFKLKEMLEKVINSSSGIPLLLTEFGADSVMGYISSCRDLWSENYHAELLLETFKLAKKYSEIAGTFPFCFSDYRDPSKVVGSYWNEINLKGMVDYHRNKKLAFYALKSIYSNLVKNSKNRRK